MLTRVNAVNDGDDITQFEITTAAAFLAFAETPADALLLEVGLGGRLDATNVIKKPALTIITPISMDHAEKLGPTLAKIAAEKAGILKRGVPGVIAQQDDDVLEGASRRAPNRGRAADRWGATSTPTSRAAGSSCSGEDRLLDLPLPGLIGRHQIVNAGTAVAAALTLQTAQPQLGIDESAIETGLRTVEWPARMQRLTGGPLPAILGPDCELWLDGGHNPAAGDMLADTLADFEEKAPQARLSRRRHDGPEGCAGLPGAVPRPRARRSTRCRSPAHTRRRTRRATWPRSRAARASMLPTVPASSRRSKQLPRSKAAQSGC